MQTIDALDIWLRGTVHGRLAMENQRHLQRFHTLCVRAIDTPVGTPQHRALVQQMRQAKRSYDAWLDQLDRGRGLGQPSVGDTLRAFAPDLPPIESLAERAARSNKARLSKD